MALSGMLLAGCSTSGSDDGAGGDSGPVGDVAEQGAVDDAEAAGGQDEQGDADAAVDQAADDGSALDSSAAEELPEDRMIARDATMTITVEDVGQAVAQARAAAVAAGGYVLSEEVQPGGEEEGDQRGYASVVLAIPSGDLDATLGAFADLGELTGQTLTSEDVTAEYRDMSARLETLEASVDRLRGLLDEASSVDEIAQLESELSRREADLDGYKARVQAIEEDVARSTVTLNLAEQQAEIAALTDPNPLVQGLSNGWDAFQRSIAGLLTVIGALLPFAALAALVLWPVLVWLRRRAVRTARPAPATSQDDTTAGRPEPAERPEHAERA